jgi:hypothetical protein
MEIVRLFFGFDVLTAAVIKGFVFWDVTSCRQVESQPIFRRNLSLPFSESRNKPSKKPASSRQ